MKKQYRVTPTFYEQLQLDHQARQRALTTHRRRPIAKLATIIVISAAGILGILDLAMAQHDTGAKPGQILNKSDLTPAQRAALNVMPAMAEKPHRVKP